LYKKRNPSYLQFGRCTISGKGLRGFTIYHRGGNHKRNFRFVDFNNYIWQVSGIIWRLEYDPNRTAIISLIVFANGFMCYRLSINGVRIGYRILVGSTKRIYLGWSAYCKSIKTGVFICNIELYQKLGSQYCRGTGCYAKLVSKKLCGTVRIDLKRSKKVIFLKNFTISTIGIIMKRTDSYEKYKKAGNLRHLGWRPVVRGIAKNPVDHPHGGRTKTCVPVTPWGKLTKGKKTGKLRLKFESILKG